MSSPRLTTPAAMCATSYVYGVEPLDGRDAWRLFVASAAGDLDTAETLLADDPRLANAQYWYRFPLHFAVFADQAEMVKLLLQRGADPGQSLYTYDSWDKLLEAARRRGNAKIEKLLHQAMRKRFRFDPEFETLRTAILTRDPKKVAAVLRKQPQLACASDALGNNGLHWSVITRQLALIGTFVAAGTPIDAPRADGQTPVMLAANGAADYWYRATRGPSHPSLRDSSVLVGSLLAHGANYGITVAATVGDQERIEQLLRHDDTLARRLDSARLSPLSRAASAGHQHLVELLLEHGADPTLPEEAAPRGRALYEACRRNHLAIAECLLAHGADPNAGVDSSECCLTIGRVYHGSLAKPLEHLLRRHGAIMPPYRLSRAQLEEALRGNHEVTRHDEFLHVLLSQQNRKLLDLYLTSPSVTPDEFDSVARAPSCSAARLRSLLDRGLNPHQTDWLGNTLLHAAAENGDTERAGVLVELGVDLHARELEFQGTALTTAIRAWIDEPDPGRIPRRRTMVEYLLDHGAATQLPDDKPWSTPHAWAINSQRAEIAELLERSAARTSKGTIL